MRDASDRLAVSQTNGVRWPSIRGRIGMHTREPPGRRFPRDRLSMTSDRENGHRFSLRSLHLDLSIRRRTHRSRLFPASENKRIAQAIGRASKARPPQRAGRHAVTLALSPPVTARLVPETMAAASDARNTTAGPKIGAATQCKPMKCSSRSIANPRDRVAASSSSIVAASVMLQRCGARQAMPRQMAVQRVLVPRRQDRLAETTARQRRTATDDVDGADHLSAFHLSENDDASVVGRTDIDRLPRLVAQPTHHRHRRSDKGRVPDKGRTDPERFASDQPDRAARVELNEAPPFHRRQQAMERRWREPGDAGDLAEPQAAGRFRDHRQHRHHPVERLNETFRCRRDEYLIRPI